MFKIKYDKPDFGSYPFESIVRSKLTASVKSNSIPVRVTSSQGTSFIIRGVKVFWPIKPQNLPYGGGTEHRSGNVLSYAYTPRDAMQLVAHFPGSGPSRSYQEANKAYVQGVCGTIWRESKEYLKDVKKKPRSLAELLDLAKYANIIEDQGVPAGVDEASVSSSGVSTVFYGWGQTVDRAYVVPNKDGCKIAERVSGCEMHHVASGSSEPGSCEFFYVTDGPKGKSAIAEVPWREDDSINGPGAYRRDATTGEMLWRSIGPLDVLPGSDADLEVKVSSESISKADGTLNHKLVATAVWFTHPSVPLTMKTRPAVLSREEVLEALAQKDIDSMVAAGVDIFSPEECEPKDDDACDPSADEKARFSQGSYTPAGSKRPRGPITSEWKGRD